MLFFTWRSDGADFAYRFVFLLTFGTYGAIKGKYAGTPSVEDWFLEAGYQHGIAQYAAALNVPVINCR